MGRSHHVSLTLGESLVLRACSRHGADAADGRPDWRGHAGPRGVVTSIAATVGWRGVVLRLLGRPWRAAPLAAQAATHRRIARARLFFYRYGFAFGADRPLPGADPQPFLPSPGVMGMAHHRFQLAGRHVGALKPPCWRRATSLARSLGTAVNAQQRR